MPFEQPVLVFDHPRSKKVFIDLNGVSCFSFVPITSCSVTARGRTEKTLSHHCSLPTGVCHTNKIFPEPSFPEVT